MEHINQCLVSVKCNSTRALYPSWPHKQLLEAADWSTESTFVQYHLRDMNEPEVLKISETQVYAVTV